MSIILVVWLCVVLFVSVFRKVVFLVFEGFIIVVICLGDNFFVILLRIFLFEFLRNNERFLKFILMGGCMLCCVLEFLFLFMILWFMFFNVVVIFFLILVWDFWSLVKECIVLFLMKFLILILFWGFRVIGMR